MTDPLAYVKQTSCSRRHRFLITTIIGGLALLFIIVGWAVSAGRVAEDAADKVEERCHDLDVQMQVHEAAQVEHEKYLEKTLDEIKVDLQEVLKIARNGK